MKIEDYNEYYIQNSNHYLIPKDVFIELFNEMSNWRKESKELNQKYVNAVADYETTMSELQELKKQVEEYQQELEKADSITQSCIFNGKEESKISYRNCLNILDKKETQQKEFVKYLKDMLDNENDIFSVVRVKDVLNKYKEIIGGKDE